MEEKERDIANDKKDEEEKQEEENYDKIKDEFQNKYSKYIKFTNKMLGSKVYELVLNKSISGAGKIVKYKKSGVNNKSNEIDFSNVLKGGNIIRQHAAYELKDEKNNIYNLIINEKANLSDLYKLNVYVRKKNLLKTIYTPFKINLSENLLRFYVKQILNGLQIIRKYGFIHFNLKLHNFLATNNLGIKISDFSMMRVIDELKDQKEKIQIPGGANGFAPPECYNKNLIKPEKIDEADIFSLGTCMYTINTGDLFFDIPKNVREKQQIAEILKIQYTRRIKRFDLMKNEGVNEEFIDLLKKMLKYNPEDRIDFEYIYRNKWINKNSKEIDKIVQYYDSDEEKVIMELQKSDILLKYYEKGEKNKKTKFDIAKIKRRYKRKNIKT